MGDAAVAGASVDGAGDINGDGYSDVIVGMPGEASGGDTLAGAVRVYFGGSEGIPAEPSQELRGGAPREFFGYTVRGLGDVNGDGFADVAVFSLGGVLRMPRVATQIRVFLGSARGLVVPAHRVIDDSQLDTSLGSLMGGRGDYNGDGYADLTAIAVGTDEGAPMRAPNRVDVFFGGPSGIASSRGYSRVGLAPREGPRATQALDVNADGFDDLIVVDSSVSATAGTLGAAQLFLSSSSGPSTGAASSIGPEMGAPFSGGLAYFGRYRTDGTFDVAVGYTTATTRGLRVFRCDPPSMFRSAPVSSRSVSRDTSAFGSNLASW